MRFRSAALCIIFSATLLLILPSCRSSACNPMELSSCSAAILSSAPPSATCCMKLKQQQQENCFCQYMKNPTLRSYIFSGNARTVAKSCKVPMPDCS